MMVSSHPRRQRKALYTASNSKRRKQMSAQIDPKLRERMALKGKAYPRSLAVRKGDRVRVVRGAPGRPNRPKSGKEVRDPPRGRTHKITGVNTRNRKIFVETKTYRKADQSELPRPIDPSNVVIVNPDWSDPRRRRIISRINRMEAMTEQEVEDWEQAEDEFEADEYEVEEEENGEPKADEELVEEASEADSEPEADEEDVEAVEAEDADENELTGVSEDIEPEVTPEEATSNEDPESTTPAGEAVNEAESKEA